MFVFITLIYPGTGKIPQKISGQFLTADFTDYTDSAMIPWD